VQAFELSESARARSLVEFLRSTETNLLANLDPELAKREKSLRQLLRAKEDARVALLTKPYEKADLESLDSELARLEGEYKSVSTLISERYPAYDQLIQPRAWNLARIQEQVISDDDTILLEYLTGEEKSYVWAVTRNTFTGHEISGDIDKAAETVLNLVTESSKTGNESELTQATQALAQMVLGPVADQLNKRRIIVIADGALNYIPFQILPSSSSNQEPLIAEHEVINAPSASILGELREKLTSRGMREKVLAAFGDPVFGRSQSNDHLQNALRDIEPNRDPKTIGELFYAEREINNLRDIASPAKTFTATRYEANRERLLSMDFSKYAILHFATHGFLDPKRPEFSGLQLSTVDEQGKELEGFIALQDVYSLRVPVDLVVMSACQTALGKNVRGEGLVGLTRGFMYAGATTVVASLWKVDDAATAELMKRFYIEMLGNRKTPDEALRIAQNSIRQIPQWRAPHYWAGFILQGEYRYVVNSERGWRRYSTLISTGIVLVFLMTTAGWYRYRVASAVKK
jgi:CHAT domain-containing protein